MLVAELTDGIVMVADRWPASAYNRYRDAQRLETLFCYPRK